MKRLGMHQASISPVWFDDDIIGALPALTRLLLLGLSCMENRARHIEATPAELRQHLLKHDRLTDAEIMDMLDDLETVGLISRREHGEGLQRITMTY